ncbi:MAG: DUF5329 domain-containing protein [Burkholderiaceae bacterium]
MTVFAPGARRPGRQLATGALLLLGLLSMSPAQAATGMTMPMEVNFLLGYVEGSGCEFERNGAWHTAREAQAHLRDKFNYLVTWHRVDTTEQFIERAATESSITSRAYMVRCKGEQTITSKQWLGDELLRLRK